MKCTYVENADKDLLKVQRLVNTQNKCSVENGKRKKEAKVTL